jgi:hypothetical protein
MPLSDLRGFEKDLGGFENLRGLGERSSDRVHSVGSLVAGGWHFPTTSASKTTSAQIRSDITQTFPFSDPHFQRQHNGLGVSGGKYC